MVIDFGKAKILKGLFAKRGENARRGRLHRSAPVAKFFQEADEIAFAVQRHVVPVRFDNDGRIVRVLLTLAVIDSYYD